MIQPLNTGKLTNSQIYTKAFYFDCADPAVNFTNGVYSTDVTFKNNSMLIFTLIKYFQDLSAYPAGINIKIQDYTPTIINSDTTPLANLVNQYAPNNQNQLVSQIIPAGNGLNVELDGITGSGITALSFMVFTIHVELDF